MHDMGDKYSNLVGFKVGNKKLYEYILYEKF